MFLPKFNPIRSFSPILRAKTLLRYQNRMYLSTEIRRAIEDAIESAPVVLFMKGTPEFPKCGF